MAYNTYYLANLMLHQLLFNFSKLIMMSIISIIHYFLLSFIKIHYRFNIFT